MALTLRISKKKTITIAAPRLEQLPKLVRRTLLAVLGLVLIGTLYLSVRALLGRTIFPTLTEGTTPKKQTTVNVKLYSKIRAFDETKRTPPESAVLQDPFGTGATFVVQ